MLEVENPMVVDRLWNDHEEHRGVDYFGDEILEGDEIFELDGETVLMDNLHRFLEEYAHGRFTLAK